MKRFALMAAMAAATLVSDAAQAQQTEGSWMVRVRALQLDPADKSDAFAVYKEDAISVSDKVIPEVDISYFWTRNIATELVLTVPQKHDVYLNGDKIGTFKHLPPTLLLQYHFAPEETFRPYVGAGINYTNIHNVDLLDGAGDLESHSWGFAFQAGFDVKIGPRTFVNFDVKKVQISSDVFVGGDRVSTVHIDPLLWGVGIGYRF